MTPFQALLKGLGHLWFPIDISVFSSGQSEHQLAIKDLNKGCGWFLNFYGSSDFPLTWVYFLPVKANTIWLYSVKKVILFPVPSRDVTNQSLPGRELLNYSRPGRVWLVTSRLGTGKTQCCGYGIRDPVPFWPLDLDLGSRIPNPYFWELSDNFFGKKFCNSLKTGPNFFCNISKIK